jgi:hypothetical protein
MLNKRIQAFGKSHHAGQTGSVVADYGEMLLVKADNEKYSGAHKNSIGDGKYFQVDRLLAKQLKE